MLLILEQGHRSLFCEGLLKLVTRIYHIVRDILHFRLIPQQCSTATQFTWVARKCCQNRHHYLFLHCMLKTLCLHSSRFIHLVLPRAYMKVKHITVKSCQIFTTKTISFVINHNYYFISCLIPLCAFVNAKLLSLS